MTPQEKIQLRILSVEAAIRAGKGDALTTAADEIFEYISQDQEKPQPKPSDIVSGTITPFARAPK